MPLRDRHIAVIDDDPDFREIVGIALKQHAQVAVVTEFSSAHEALAAVHRVRLADAVLVDLHMPRMDGAAFTRTLRDRGYGGPVIVVSAAASELDARECLAAGADAVLAKSGSLGALAQQICEACRKAAQP